MVIVYILAGVAVGLLGATTVRDKVVPRIKPEYGRLSRKSWTVLAATSVSLLLLAGVVMLLAGQWKGLLVIGITVFALHQLFKKRPVKPTGNDEDADVEPYEEFEVE